MDRAGKTLKTIAQCPDGNWLGDPGYASVAPDRALAVIARGAVDLYSATGGPIRTFGPPMSVEWAFPRVAYGGKRVVVAGKKTPLVLFEASGKALGRLTPSREAWWIPFLAPDGRWLLLFDETKALQRFELP